MRLRLAGPPSSCSELLPPAWSRLLPWLATLRRLPWLATLGRLPRLAARGRPPLGASRPLPWPPAGLRPPGCATPGWLSELPLPALAACASPGGAACTPGLGALGGIGGSAEACSAAAAGACAANGARPTACSMLAETCGWGRGRPGRYEAACP